MANAWDEYKKKHGISDQPAQQAETENAWERYKRETGIESGTDIWQKKVQNRAEATKRNREAQTQERRNLYAQKREIDNFTGPQPIGGEDAMKANYYYNLSQYGAKYGDAAAQDEGFRNYRQAMANVDKAYSSELEKNRRQDAAYDTFRQAAERIMPFQSELSRAGRELTVQDQRYTRDANLYNQMGQAANQTGSRALWDKAAKGYEQANADYMKSFNAYGDAYNDRKQAELSHLEENDHGTYVGMTTSSEEVEQRLKDLNVRKADLEVKREALEKELETLKMSGQVSSVDSHGIGHYGNAERDYNIAINDLAAVEAEIKLYTNAKKYQDRQKGNAIFEQYFGGGKVLAPEMVRKSETGKVKYEADRKAAEERGTETLDYGWDIVRKTRGVWRTEKDRLEEANWDPTFDDASNLNSEDRMLFYALYADDPEQAMFWARYANDIRNEEYERWMAEWAGENGWNAGAAFFQALGDRIGSGAVNLVDPHSATANQLARTASGLLAGGGQLLNEWSGTFDTDIPIVKDFINGKGLGDFYQLANSIVESGINAYAAKKLGAFIPGGGEAGISALGVMLMGSSASAADYNECIKRGLTPGQAQKHALAAGINEALFEFVSVDKLLDEEKLMMASTVSEKIKGVFAQAGVEASEEFCTTVANRLADAAQARRDGYDTQIEQRAKELIALGLSRDEAMEKAEKEWLTELINDAIGGFISGGGLKLGAYAVSAPARAAVNAVQNARETNKVNETKGSFTSAEEAAALRSFAEANGVKYNAETVQRAAEARGAREADSSATPQNDSGENTETKLSRREIRQERRANRETGALESDVVKKLSETVHERGLNNAQAIFDEQTQQHGAAITRVVQQAIVNEARTVFAQAQNQSELTKAYQQAVETATAKPVKQALKQAYQDATTLRAYQGDKEAMTDALIGGGSGRALDLSAELTAADGSTQQVQIKALNTKQGEIVLDNGSTVTLDELQGLDADTKDVIQRLDAFELGEARPIAFLAYQTAVEKGEVTDGTRWVMSWALAFDQGRNGAISVQEAVKRSSLPADVVRKAYELGAEQTETWRRQKEAENAEKRKKAEDGATGRKGILDTSRVSQENLDKLSTDKKDALSTLELIAESTGVDIRLIAQKVTKRGNVKGYQGLYNKDGNYIEIDINAGINNIFEDLNTGMTAVLGHELTHWMQENAPTEYLAYKKAVLQAIMSTKNGELALERMIETQIKQNKRAGKEITRSQAEDEVVADASMKRMGDTEFWDAVSENLGDKKADVFAKIKEYISQFFNRVREIIGKASHTSEAAKLIDRVEADVQATLRRLYAEGIGAAMRATSGQTVTEAEQVAAEKGGAVIDAKSESAAPTDLEMHSERTWSESRFVQDRENAAKALAKALNCSAKKATKYIDDINSVAATIAGDRARLDYLSSPGRSAFKSNAEYGGSIDFSTLCKKRRLLTGTFTAIQKALANTVLTAEDVLKIRQMMLDKGLEVSCGLCYVEGSRSKMGEYNKTFLDLYKKYFPDRWQPTMADVNTADGIEQVRIDHSECYEQFEYFYNHYGTLREGDKAIFSSQAKPKEYQLRTEYKGEIITQFDDSTDVETKNRNGGMRLQSFSDFEIVHLIDCMQVIMDMSEVGLAGQAYTKVPEFAEALGKTGLKINLSLIAKGVDENGRIIYNDTEGMNHNTAFDIRRRFSDNVGTILVVYDDAQLKAAMADEMVDFIIPFHRSQWKKSQYKAMGLPTTTKDYTYQQNEKWLNPNAHTHEAKTGQKRQVPTKCTNYMPNEYWDTNLTGKQNAEAYLAMCARDGKRPKFYKLLQNNGDGSYSLQPDGSTDGYWKLLVDFKMYNNKGKGAPQKPVQPIFNMTSEDPNAVTVESMLRDYTGGHQNFPVAQGIVDQFVEQYKAEHLGQQLSTRDYNSTVILEESTIDKYLRDYASKTSPNYAQAYIVRMSPDDFLNLTTSKTGRDTIWKQTGELDVDKLKKATIDQPFQLYIDTKSGQVEGHEGRHRAMALYNNGVNSIPVLLFDSSNKYDKTALGSLELKGQDFGSSRSYANITVRDVQPLSYANRDNVVQKFTTQPAAERYYERAGMSETIRYSTRPTTDSTGQALPQQAVKAVFPTASSAFGSMKDLMSMAIDGEALQQARQDAEVPEIVKDIQKTLPGLEATMRETNSDEEKISKYEAWRDKYGFGEQNAQLSTRAFDSVKEIDEEINRLSDEYNRIFNDDRIAREKAKKDPRVVKLQEAAWKAEDEKGRVGSLKERMAYHKMLDEVIEEMKVTSVDDSLSEIRKQIDELKAEREALVSVTPITGEQYKKLIDYFGTTQDYDTAGFILQDGQMLDFSGKKQYGKNYAGGREIYHNEVGEVLNLETDTSPRINMINNGNIRLAPEVNGINLTQKPTAKQREALRGYIDHNDGNVQVDIDNTAGRTVETLHFYPGTSATRVLNDIDAYFDTGEAPAPQSDLRAFYSTRPTTDSTGRELSEGQQAYFKDSRARDVNGNLLVLYRGKRGGETVIHGDYRGAIWTTTDPEFADRYGVKDELYANIKNPYYRTVYNTDSDTGYDIDKVIHDAKSGGHDGAIISFMLNPGVATGYVEYAAKNHPNEPASEILKSWTKSSYMDAHEGETIANFWKRANEGPVSQHVVVFSSEQIKRADNLNPTKNPDIRLSTRDYSDVSDLDLLMNAAEEISEGGGEEYWASLLENEPGLAGEAEEIKRLGKQLKKTEADLAEARRNLTLTDRKLKTRGIASLAATIMRDQKAGDINKKDVKNRITDVLTDAYQKALDQLDAGADVGTAWETVYSDGVVKAADILLTDATYAEKLGYKWYKNTLGAYLGDGAREYVEADIGARVAEDFQANRYRPGQKGTVADRLVAQAENRVNKKLDAAKTENAALKAENAKLSEDKAFFKEQAETAAKTAQNLYEQLVEKREELKNNKKISADERKATLKRLDNLERQMKAKRREAEVWKSKAETGWKAASQAIRERDAAVEKLEKQLQRERDILEGKLRPPAIQKMLAAAREREGKRIAEMKDERFAAYKEKQSAAQLRSRIKNLSDEMKRKMTRPTDGAYVPASLYGAMTQVADLLDKALAPKAGTKAEAKYRAMMDAIHSLANEYGKVAEMDDYTYKSEFDAEIMDEIKELEEVLTKDQSWVMAASNDNRALREYSLGDLTRIYDILRTINEAMTSASHFLGKANFQSIWDAMGQIAEQQGDMTSFNRLGWYGKKKRMRMLDSLNVMRAVEMMSNWDRSAALYRIMQQVENGVDVSNAWMMEYNKAMQALKTGKNEKAYRDALTKKLDYSVTDEEGLPVLMTKMQALQILMTAEREAHNDKLVHLQRGGATIRDALAIQDGKKDAASQTIKVTPELIQRIQDSLTEWDKAYMKAIRDYFGKEGKATNRVLYALKHRVLQTEDYYVPYAVDKNYLDTDLNETQAMNMWVKTPGSTNALQKKASQPVIIDGMDTVMAKHVREIADYIGLAIPIRDFAKVYNGRLKQNEGENPLPVKQTIDKNWKAKGQHLLTQSIIDVQGGSRGASWSTAIAEHLNALQSAFVKSALLVNPSVTIKQAASYAAAGSILSHAALDRANHPISVKTDESNAFDPATGLIGHIFFAPNGATATRIYNEIDKYTSLHYQRRLGMSQAELANEANRSGKLKRAMNSVGASMEQTTAGHIARKVGASLNPVSWIQRMDVATTATLWLACKEQARMDGMKVGTDEYWKHVTELYERVIRETQPMYDSLHRNAGQKNRENSLMQYLFPFRTVPIQNHGQIAASYETLQAALKSKDEAQIKEAKKFFAKTMWAQTESAIIFSLMSFIAAALKRKTKKYRDEDEEISLESVLRGIGSDTAGTMFSNFFPLFGSAIWDSAGNIYDSVKTGKKVWSYDAYSVGVVDLMNEFAKACESLVTDVANMIAGKDVGWDKLRGDILDTLVKSMKCIGIPASTIKTYTEGFAGNLQDLKEGRIPALNDVSWERSAAVNANRYLKAWIADDDAKVETVKAEMMGNYTEAGKDEEEANKALKTKLTATAKDAFSAGTLDMTDAILFLVDTGYYDEDDAWNKVRQWAAENEHEGDEEYKWNQYEDLRAAFDAGTGIEEAIKELEDHGYSETQLADEISDNIRGALTAGAISEETAIDYLKRYRGMDEDKAWKKVQEWQAKAEHADEEDYSYSQYDEIDAAIDANKEIKDLVSELTAHGVKAESITSHVKQHLVENYVNGSVSETALRNQLSRYCRIVAKDDVDKIVNDAKCRKDTGYAYSALDEAYRSGEVSKTTMKNALMKYGGKTSAEADKKLRWWDLQVSKPSLEISESAANAWYDGTTKSRENGQESAKAAGMSIEAYLKAKAVLDEIKDANDNGSGEDEVIAALAKMNLSARQKDALYYERYKGTTKISKTKSW